MLHPLFVVDVIGVYYLATFKNHLLVITRNPAEFQKLRANIFFLSLDINFNVCALTYVSPVNIYFDYKFNDTS